MGLNNISRGLGYGIGKLVGGTRKVLFWPGSTLSKATEQLRSVSPNARNQTTVTEELMHAETPMEASFEQRLQVMAETILALQKRLDELVASGHISGRDILEAMNSLKVAYSLTNNERTVLVNVFRQNIALQKPELVNAAAGNTMSEGI